MWRAALGIVWAAASFEGIWNSSGGDADVYVAVLEQKVLRPAIDVNMFVCCGRNQQGEQKPT